MDGVAPPWPFPSTGLLAVPPVTAETSSVKGVQGGGPTAPRQVSRTYPSGNFAFGTIRFVASEEKATNRPLKLNTGSWLLPFGGAPFAPGEITWAPPGGPGLITNITVLESGERSGLKINICADPGMAISAAGI